MDGEEIELALIGFGEAAQAFAAANGNDRQGDWHGRVYDRKTDSAVDAAAKRADYARFAITGCDSMSDAVSGATLILSLVTADQALLAAEAAARHIASGALYGDCNSVAPATKQAAARVIEAAGGRYVDIAILAPVHPARRAVPLLLSGPHAGDAAARLTALGFAKTSIADGPVGRASSIKMIRSVMVKGIEALTAEWILAAEAAGIRDEAVAALNASWPGIDWAEKADYNLDRMMMHGLRRAAEMEEVVKTLDALGTGAAMTRGTVLRQRAIGELGLDAAPDGLDAKLDMLLPLIHRNEDRSDAA